MRYSPGQCFDGRYEIRSLLGQGAMAEVYHALDRQTGREVVLKLPHLELGGDLTAFRRYRHEMQIASRLDAPGVQRLLSPPGAAYMVLEYVEGESLRTYLARHGPLDVEAVRSIGLQLARTLEHVHSKGIVHRDIKPENVLIQPPDHVTLTDFGIAERTSRSRWWRLAQLENAVGTPDYMAPEQVRGERADARTDVYALGSLLYELLTGDVPHPAGSSSSEPVLVRRARPDVPPALEAVLYRAVRRRASARYPSMAALADDLEHLETAPVPARYELDEPAPRAIGDLPPWRSLVLLVVLVLLVLLAVGVAAQLAHQAARH